jgi:hypothetical protein
MPTNADPTPTVTATVPVLEPPVWAVLQRRLFDVLDVAWRRFERRYCAADGGLVFDGELTASRDGVDDFYEPFFNWPLLYQLGGADDLLGACKRHWEGVTRQLTASGFLKDEYEVGYDWFHQGESLLFFYGICAADPADGRFRERARRFAELYLAGSPVGNYDPQHRIIRAPHTGAGGPRWGSNDEWASFGPDLVHMRRYGLPIEGLPGIAGWDDLADPDNARQMGQAIQERFGRGDVAVNLAATTLMVNAWLYDQDPRFADWVAEYVGAWCERAAANGGVIPDNVGQSEQVGELMDGHWFGGAYGWTWPHGLHSVEAGALIGAINAHLIDGEERWFDLARAPLDSVMAQSRRGRLADEDPSLGDSWAQRLGAAAADELLLVPYRIGVNGWFDYHPMQIAFPAWLWWCSRAERDRARLRDLAATSGYDWCAVEAFRDKEEAGHEAPWLSYLAGCNPSYPERALGMALGQVARRLALIGADTAAIGTDVHWWQRLNPVVTEVLVQLTTGAPAALYNGGLQLARVRYSDADSRRPGLPPDVAALVEDINPEHTSVHLVNLSPTQTRRLVVQAGAFGEDRIDTVAFDHVHAGYPGSSDRFAAPALQPGRADLMVGGRHLAVTLPPTTRVHLDLSLSLRRYTPTHQHPQQESRPTDE